MPIEPQLPAITPDELCVDFFAQRSRLVQRVEELVRQVQEAESIVRALRAELSTARAVAARGH